MSVFKRSANSIAWTSVANVIKIAVLFVRSILLARWLPIPIFGIYATSRAIVEVTRTLPSFGMGAAFIHRATEVSDEQDAAIAHFTLKLLLTTLWLLVMLTLAVIYSEGQLQLSLIVITVSSAIGHLTQTPDLILDRRIIHRRLAIIQIITAFSVSIISIAMGWMATVNSSDSWALWALLVGNVLTPIVSVFALYVWRPVWRPKLGWDSAIIKYFLTYGSKNYAGILLLNLIDRVDDLWTRIYLGNDALSFYSQSYKFATYPRELLARPMNKVVRGTFAELKGDRHRLSQAFFQSNALLLRTGFWIGGILFLIAPEWIELLLTDKWLPLANLFRLMLIFTLLDPIRMSAANLMVVMGDAHRPIPVRVLQLFILVAAMYLLGPRWGAEGVAVAANITLAVGVLILFWQANRYVSFSWRKLIQTPTIAMILGFSLCWLALQIVAINDSTFISASIKITAYSVGYIAVMLLLERSETIRLIGKLLRLNKK